MDYNSSGSGGILGVVLLFGTGIADLIRRFSENANIQDVASFVSICVGTLAFIYYFITICEKVAKWFKKEKV